MHDLHAGRYGNQVPYSLTEALSAALHMDTVNLWKNCIPATTPRQAMHYSNCTGQNLYSEEQCEIQPKSLILKKGKVCRKL